MNPKSVKERKAINGGTGKKSQVTPGDHKGDQGDKVQRGGTTAH